MTEALEVWNEMLEIVARPVRTQPGVDRTLREILDAIDVDAGPEETQARAREFLRANRARLTTEQLDGLIAYGMCASDAVKAMVPHIGTAAAWARGLKHDKQKGGDAKRMQIDAVRLPVLALFTAGSGRFHSMRDAARQLTQPALALSKEGYNARRKSGWMLSETNAEETVYGWIRKHEEQTKK